MFQFDGIYFGHVIRRVRQELLSISTQDPPVQSSRLLLLKHKLWNIVQLSPFSKVLFLLRRVGKVGKRKRVHNGEANSNQVIYSCRDIYTVLAFLSLAYTGYVQGKRTKRYLLQQATNHKPTSLFAVQAGTHSHAATHTLILSCRQLTFVECGGLGCMLFLANDCHLDLSGFLFLKCRSVDIMFPCS